MSFICRPWRKLLRWRRTSDAWRKIFEGKRKIWSWHTPAWRPACAGPVWSSVGIRYQPCLAPSLLGGPGGADREGGLRGSEKPGCILEKTAEGLSNGSNSCVAKQGSKCRSWARRGTREPRPLWNNTSALLTAVPSPCSPRRPSTG